MSKRLLLTVCAMIAAILTLSGILAGASLKTTLAQSHSAPPMDGVLHVHSLVIPPSNYLSPAFKREYEAIVAAMYAPSQPDRIPARNASKAVWDKFYALEGRELAVPLAWDLKHYPVNVVDTRIAGVHVGIISPKDGIAPENQHRILINLHGGGFFEYSGLSFGQLESVPVASLGKVKVITVDYRQAPRYQYPAATQDVAAVYKALLKQFKPENIGIFGCSAGGILTSQAVAWFQIKGLPRPGAIGIFCAAPPTLQGWGGDSKMWGLGYSPPSEKSGILPKAISNAVAWYMESAGKDDPAAYPGSWDKVLKKFPPTLFLTGTRTFDLSPSIVANARLLRLGVDSSLYVIEGGWHGAHVSAIGTPEAHDANAYIAHWFEQHLGR